MQKYESRHRDTIFTWSPTPFISVTKNCYGSKIQGFLGFHLGFVLDYCPPAYTITSPNEGSNSASMGKETSIMGEWNSSYAKSHKDHNNLLILSICSFLYTISMNLWSSSTATGHHDSSCCAICLFNASLQINSKNPSTHDRWGCFEPWSPIREPFPVTWAMHNRSIWLSAIHVRKENW